MSYSRASIFRDTARTQVLLLRTRMDGKFKSALGEDDSTNMNRDIYRSSNIVIQDSVINNGDGKDL